MSSDDDAPAPSPSAAVLVRRASREAKSMREESGSEEDSDEPRSNGRATTRSLPRRMGARRRCACRTPSAVARLTSRQYLGARSTTWASEDGSAAWAQDMLEFADDNFNDAGIEVRSIVWIKRMCHTSCPKGK